MREYGQIQCSFWADPEIQVWSDDAKLLACYLLTGPHTNGLGCYRLPDGYVTDDLGWSPQRVSKSFNELLEEGFCNRCESTKFVLIPKYLRWNPVINENVGKARQKEFDLVSKKSSIYSNLVSVMIAYVTQWTEPFRNHLETLSKQNPYPTPTQPLPGKDPENKSAEADSPPGGEQFCPHMEIIDLYHEALPAGRKIIKERWRGSSGEKGLRARWKESKVHQDLDFWRELFSVVAKTDKWNGNNQIEWCADLRWIVTRKNFDKVVES